MYTPLSFPDLLRLIDEQSATFRTVVASAPSLDVPVPSCPGWTLADLAQHIGQGRRKWARIVAAGPADGPVQVTDTLPEGREAVTAWLAEGTRLLLDSLRAAGPEGACWTWWADSQSPQNAWSVARHQLQELAVHTYDAQLALGKEEPLDSRIAVDGVHEFLTTCCATSSPWPHEPATLDFRTLEGEAWRLVLSGEGARVVAPDETAASAGVLESAGVVVLWMYNRVGLEGLDIAGEQVVFEQLRDWDPEA